MTIQIDRHIFSDAVISKAVYSLSGDLVIERRLSDNDTETVIATVSGTFADDEAIRSIIFRTLNDYKLRQIIAEETRDIKTLLYAKAFAEDDELSEEDIHD